MRLSSRALRGATLGLAVFAAALVTLPEPARASQDCAGDVASMQQQAQIAAITGNQTLAQQVILAPTESYGSMSCLDSILNMGIDIFFGVPSLSQILDMIMNAICQAAMSLVNQAKQTVMQKISTATGGLTSGLNGSLPLSNLMPGVNLGSINGGLYINPTSGSNGFVTTNAISAIGASNFDVATSGINSAATNVVNGLFGN